MIEQILFSILVGVTVILIVTKLINLYTSILKVFLAAIFSSVVIFFIPYYIGIPFFYEIGSIIAWTIGIKLFVCRNTSDAAKIALVVFASIYSLNYLGLSTIFYRYVSI